MVARSRWFIPFIVASIFAVTAATGLAGTTHGGRLTGTWSGYITAGPKRQHMVIVVNATETGGSWRLGPRCYGPLKLQDISSGYHHYLRERGRGSTCSGGDVDCLKPVGANVYDAVTSVGAGYFQSGTLQRVRRA
jgi:hypothetical protein